jgi:hypothetical protein
MQDVLFPRYPHPVVSLLRNKQFFYLLIFKEPVIRDLLPPVSFSFIELKTYFQSQCIANLKTFENSQSYSRVLVYNFYELHRRQKSKHYSRGNFVRIYLLSLASDILIAL